MLFTELSRIGAYGQSSGLSPWISKQQGFCKGISKEIRDASKRVSAEKNRIVPFIGTDIKKTKKCSCMDK